MLLERKYINPDHPDIEYGMTPLSWAAGNGHEGIVKILLERGDVNPDHKDTKYRRTPLSRAAENGHEAVVKMLLGRKDVNPSPEITQSGRTLLSWMAEKGNEGVVEMLLGRKDVNPDHPDIEYGRTPLSWAAGNGHEGIVKMLLEREEVNPNRPDTKYDRTPLSWVAGNLHEGVVKMLMERKDDRIANLDSVNQAPQSMALSEGHDRVARIPPERDNVNSAAANRSSPMSLPLAAMHPDEPETLSGSPDSYIDITESSGQPALQSAANSERPRVLGHGGPASQSVESGLSTQPPRWSRPFSTRPLKHFYHRIKTKTHPRKT